VKVLLTGGAGFIGTAVQDQLTAFGHIGRIFDRAVDPRDDVCDLPRLQDALAGSQAVIHLAAKVGLGVELADIDDYVRQNDLGTAVVLRAAAAAEIPRIIYASSMVVYGEGAYSCVDHGPVPAPPRTPDDLARGCFEPGCPECGLALTPGLVPETAPMDPRNVYAATKVHGEQLAGIWCRETDGRVAALRFHNVYGPGMPQNTPYAGVASLFRASLERGQAPEVFEDGLQRRSFVHVADVARAVVAALTADLPGGLTALNIGSPRVTTIGEMAQGLSDALVGPDPVVTGRYRLGDVRHISADCSRAERVLGWSPTIGLTEGIASVVTDVREASRVETARGRPARHSRAGSARR
jgi:dTDP-L-rhamnose 4-epimerase